MAGYSREFLSIEQALNYALEQLSENEILNPKKINDKIKPTDDFNILWKKLIKIRQLYVSDVMPKKWYTVDNLDNLKKLKKIFK